MDGVLVLINVVIANLIQLDLVLCVVLFCEVGATIVAQAKDDLYCDQDSTNMYVSFLNHRGLYVFVSAHGQIFSSMC
jgi:hypothetical protein